MLQPFGELTNRTPSPSQHEQGRYARKHSPWTAARNKKKTRSFQSSLLDASHEPSDCCASPENVIKTSSIAEDIETEYSLADGISSGASGSSVSPHTSPPIDRDQDAEVHPAKAYIVDQQATSPDLPPKPAGSGSSNSRSPMWFGSAVLQEQLATTSAADQQQIHLHHSSSAPSNVLFERFDAVEQQPDSSSCMDTQHIPQLTITANLPPNQLQQAPAAAASAAAAALPGRRKGLVARRRSWAGAEVRRASAAAAAAGISRLAASSTCAGSSGGSIHLVAELAAAGTAGGLAAAAGQQQHSYRLHNSIGSGSSRHRLAFDDDDSFSIRCPVWDVCDIRQQDEIAHDYKLAAAGQLTGVAQDSLEWFEQQLEQAAEEDDLATAQQLWCALQASGLRPTRQVLINYLMCCYYGGGDPIDAEQVVRETCAAAGTEPDAVMLQMLASIDMTWQQLHCGF